MKAALIYDRQFLSDYWRRGGVWAAYGATRLALETVGVEVSNELGDEDVTVFWDALEAMDKYAWHFMRRRRPPSLVKLGGYFQGDPDLGIPWKFLGEHVDAVVVSAPSMVLDARKRCDAPTRWIPDGYDPRIFWAAGELGDDFLACCGLDEYRGCGRVMGSGLAVRVVGPEGDWEKPVGYEGDLPHEEMGGFLRQGKLFLSLVGKSMGFTISRLEALACGLPMACSDQGWQGLCEGTSLVFSLLQLETDPTLVLRTVKDLSSAELARMREAALGMAARFTPDKIGELWLDLLGGMIS